MTGCGRLDIISSPEMKVKYVLQDAERPWNSNGVSYKCTAAPLIIEASATTRDKWPLLWERPYVRYDFGRWGANRWIIMGKSKRLKWRMQLEEYDWTPKQNIKIQIHCVLWVYDVVSCDQLTYHVEIRSSSFQAFCLIPYVVICHPRVIDHHIISLNLKTPSWADHLGRC